MSDNFSYNGARYFSLPEEVLPTGSVDSGAAYAGVTMPQDGQSLTPSQPRSRGRKQVVQINPQPTPSTQGPPFKRPTPYPLGAQSRPRHHVDHLTVPDGDMISDLVSSDTSPCTPSSTVTTPHSIDFASATQNSLSSLPPQSSSVKTGQQLADTANRKKEYAGIHAIRAACLGSPQYILNEAIQNLKHSTEENIRIFDEYKCHPDDFLEIAPLCIGFPTKRPGQIHLGAEVLKLQSQQIRELLAEKEKYLSEITSLKNQCAILQPILEIVSRGSTVKQDPAQTPDVTTDIFSTGTIPVESPDQSPSVSSQETGASESGGQAGNVLAMDVDQDQELAKADSSTKSKVKGKGKGLRKLTQLLPDTKAGHAKKDAFWKLSEIVASLRNDAALWSSMVKMLPQGICPPFFNAKRTLTVSSDRSNMSVATELTKTQIYFLTAAAIELLSARSKEYEKLKSDQEQMERQVQTVQAEQKAVIEACWCRTEVGQLLLSRFINLQGIESRDAPPVNFATPRAKDLLRLPQDLDHMAPVFDRNLVANPLIHPTDTHHDEYGECSDSGNPNLGHYSHDGSQVSFTPLVSQNAVSGTAQPIHVPLDTAWCNSAAVRGSKPECHQGDAGGLRGTVARDYPSQNVVDWQSLYTANALGPFF